MDQNGGSRRQLPDQRARNAFLPLAFCASPFSIVIHPVTYRGSEVATGQPGKRNAWDMTVLVLKWDRVLWMTLVFFVQYYICGMTALIISNARPAVVNRYFFSTTLNLVNKKLIGKKHGIYGSNTPFPGE